MRVLLCEIAAKCIAIEGGDYRKKEGTQYG